MEQGAARVDPLGGGEGGALELRGGVGDDDLLKPSDEGVAAEEARQLHDGELLVEELVAALLQRREHELAPRHLRVELGARRALEPLDPRARLAHRHSVGVDQRRRLRRRTSWTSSKRPATASWLSSFSRPARSTPSTRRSSASHCAASAPPPSDAPSSTPTPPP